LYERALEGLLKFSAAIGRPHPSLQTSVSNYAGCLEELGGRPEQIRSALGQLCQRYGFSIGGAPDNPDTLAKLTSLADQLDNSGRGEEAAPVRLRIIEIQERTLGPDHADTLRAWNQYAYSIRKRGRADLAEPFDQKLLASTIRALGEDAPLTIHRRNNLVLSLIMLGRLEEARAGLESNLKAKAPLQANTTPRIWFLEFLVDLLESRPTQQPLGRLKTFMLGEPTPNHPKITVPWDVGYFLEAIKAKVPADAFAFLVALVAALNDRANVAKLDEFPAWREVAPEPLP
jgi:tetratricopeptide (TPR) repeat protein